MSERLIYKILKSNKTVFSLNEISLISNEKESPNLKSKINYYVKKGLLLNIRKGFYAKPNYNIEEFICKLYTPSYLSLEYVLQKESVIFQYSSNITAISYLSREIISDNYVLKYRKLKNSILLDTTGINRLDNGINIASAERAVLDSMHLNKTGYFDNISKLNIEFMEEMLPLFQSKSLEKLFNKAFKNV